LHLGLFGQPAASLFFRNLLGAGKILRVFWPSRPKATAPTQAWGGSEASRLTLITQDVIIRS